jgi:hypothetical protein
VPAEGDWRRVKGGIGKMEKLEKLYGELDETIQAIRKFYLKYPGAYWIDKMDKIPDAKTPSLREKQEIEQLHEKKHKLSQQIDELEKKIFPNNG